MAVVHSAAKKTTWWHLGLAAALVVTASGLFSCAPATASSIAFFTGKTRAELSPATTTNRVEFRFAIPETASSYYDASGEAASDSPVAPRGVAARAPAVTRIDRPNLHTALPSRLKGDNLAVPGAFDDVMVIGTLDDTARFIGTEGHNVLRAGTWNIHVNDGWMMRGFFEGRKFRLATQPHMSDLRAVRRVTEDGTVIRALSVFHRELKMLRDAGYVRQGDFLVPGN